MKKEDINKDQMKEDARDLKQEIVDEDKDLKQEQTSESIDDWKEGISEYVKNNFDDVNGEIFKQELSKEDIELEKKITEGVRCGLGSLKKPMIIYEEKNKEEITGALLEKSLELSDEHKMSKLFDKCFQQISDEVEDKDNFDIQEIIDEVDKLDGIIRRETSEIDKKLERNSLLLSKIKIGVDDLFERGNLVGECNVRKDLANTINAAANAYENIEDQEVRRAARGLALAAIGKLHILTDKI